jgi:hypothetical protein
MPGDGLVAIDLVKDGPCLAAPVAITWRFLLARAVPTTGVPEGPWMGRVRPCRDPSRFTSKTRESVMLSPHTLVVDDHSVGPALLRTDC